MKHKTAWMVGLGATVAMAISGAFAADLKVGETAPSFTTKTDEGKTFRLEDRKGQWTVLYFYPKAETPGCTQQACAYRDSLKKIRALKADVFGISADDAAALKKFRANHQLNFTLLEDPKLQVIDQYGVRMMGLPMSKRWTFVIDPQLVIRKIDQGVDPVQDAANVAAHIAEFQKTTPPQ